MGTERGMESSAGRSEVDTIWVSWSFDAIVARKWSIRLGAVTKVSCEDDHGVWNKHDNSWKDQKQKWKDWKLRSRKSKLKFCSNEFPTRDTRLRKQSSTYSTCASSYSMISSVCHSFLRLSPTQAASVRSRLDFVLKPNLPNRALCSPSEFLDWHKALSEFPRVKEGDQVPPDFGRTMTMFCIRLKLTSTLFQLYNLLISYRSWEQWPKRIPISTDGAREDWLKLSVISTWQRFHVQSEGCLLSTNSYRSQRMDSASWYLSLFTWHHLLKVELF